MSAASDIAYGRKGGTFIPPAPPAPSAWPSHREPTTATIAEHLADHHLTTGITLASMVGVDPLELLRWHDVDHRHVRPDLLGHTHSGTHDAEPVPTDPDEKIHAATLKAIAEGRTVAGVDDMCKRAATVAVRQARAKAAREAGERPAPGDAVVSPHDRRCLEVAKAVADRAARRTRRSAA